MEHSAIRIIKYVYLLTLAIGLIVWAFNMPEYITKDFSRECGEDIIVVYNNQEDPQGIVNTHYVSLNDAQSLHSTSEMKVISRQCYLALEDFENKGWPILGKQVRKWQLSLIYFFMILTAICLGAHLYFRNSDKS